MACKLCQSHNQRNFNAEINVHFPGRNNLDKPSVFTFPKLLVCLNCGFTEFVLETPELLRLKQGSAEVEGFGESYGT